MKFRKVTAIIRPDRLETVEDHLKEMDVPGISVSKVKGYGEYANFFSEDWFSTHIRIVIYTGKKHAKEIAKSIMENAYTGVEGDGLITISSVETVYHIRRKEECLNEVCS